MRHLPEGKQADDLREHLRQTEVALIESALKRTIGNVAHAALMLNLPRPTLIHKMKRYAIDAHDYRYPKKTPKP